MYNIYIDIYYCFSSTTQIQNYLIWNEQYSLSFLLAQGGSKVEVWRPKQKGARTSFPHSCLRVCFAWRYYWFTFQALSELEKLTVASNAFERNILLFRKCHIAPVSIGNFGGTRSVSRIKPHTIFCFIFHTASSKRINGKYTVWTNKFLTTKEDWIITHKCSK